jgi:hypothetical protein
MNKDLPENFVSDSEKILRKARLKLRSPDSRPTTFALGDSIARTITPTLLTVKIRQPSHEFTFGVGMSFIPYPLVLTPVV